MTKLLYIAAWGRSGTTVLDNILNVYPGVCSAGELYFVWSRGLLQNRRCGCGRPFRDCPFWTDVLRAAYGSKLPDPAEMMALQASVARVRHTTRLVRQLARAQAEPVRRYQRIMVRLYDAVAQVSGADLVIDSSKLPSGAACLIDAAIEPYLLHMTRDPRAVAFSWQRPTRQLDQAHLPFMDRHSARTSALNWLAWNALIENVSRRLPHRLRLRYEDFIAAPRATVDRVLRLVGVPQASSPFLGPSTVELRGNHTVSGNPTRFQTGRVELRPDDAWRVEQTRRDQLLTTVVTMPLLRRYGYATKP